MRSQLRNNPLPQPHLIALGVGVGLELLTGWVLPLPSWLRLVGLGMVAAGLALIAWATWASAGTHLTSPDRLVTTGPYAIGRNPMYLGWTLAYLGAASTLAAVWLMLLLPAVLVATHLTVHHEESRLRARFGAAYATYATAVRRWV
jgi:protein-S-isoprenylcysteine O-methyltransferase Ste14